MQIATLNQQEAVQILIITLLCSPGESIRFAGNPLLNRL
jgi:hypothetical protein